MAGSLRAPSDSCVEDPTFVYISARDLRASKNLVGELPSLAFSELSSLRKAA